MQRSGGLWFDPGQKLLIPHLNKQAGHRGTYQLCRRCRWEDHGLRLVPRQKCETLSKK
jgi:hypothetical protein